MKAVKDLFPKGIAAGDAFCNRVKERGILSDNIKSIRHTVLLAPRRYGKTSLVNQVIKDLGYLSCEMDFLLSANLTTVEGEILKSVGELLHKLLPKTKKARDRVLNFFKTMRPEIVFSAAGQKVVLHLPENHSSQQTICDILLNLDKAAAASKKPVVIFMDEFQQIGALDDNHTIEASIRHAAERSTHVSYIFSGSNRHMLLQMFGDQSRPFYRLCEVMKLQRMREEDYIHFIQKHAKEAWKKEFDLELIKFVLNLSERHSFYVNLLCHALWKKGVLATKDFLMRYWIDYIENEKAIFVSDLSKLSNNQKLLMRALAISPVKQPYAKAFMLKTSLGIASQKQAMQQLLNKDLVYMGELGFYRVLDPAMKAYINSLYVR